jgi:hypothetical protein
VLLHKIYKSLSYNLNDGKMGYGRFNRGRGFGRGFGMGWGRGLGMGWSRGRGFRVGSGFGMNSLSYDRLSHERQWMGNTPYSNMFAGQRQSLYPQQSQHTQSSIYQQSPMLGFTHMNCIHYSNGFCTIKNMQVDPYGTACQRFMPR